MSCYLLSIGSIIIRIILTLSFSLNMRHCESFTNGCNAYDRVSLKMISFVYLCRNARILEIKRLNFWTNHTYAITTEMLTWNSLNGTQYTKILSGNNFKRHPVDRAVNRHSPRPICMQISQSITFTPSRMFVQHGDDYYYNSCLGSGIEVACMLGASYRHLNRGGISR